ncbi:AAA family ATPase, partial [Achromobacter arsenitoxydans]|uniref:AAA family ATPase n=1 Tax=Achromobacter arsenitoxydans TaxID=1147684 RepID=UPI0019309BD4
LSVHIENTFNLDAHRISAHRALTLNPSVPKISEREAIRGLRTGLNHASAGVQHRAGNRWQSKQAVSLLNDFDFVVQALFAEQANTSLATHKNVRAGTNQPPNPTLFERLTDIWQRLLPHRVLHISGDDIQVSPPNTDTRYNASEMSDGERAIFYLIGQTLVAAPNSLLVIDEPELHVHRSVISKLWDELESARQDCAFVFITHDLDFAAARIAQKYVIRDYDPAPRWTLDVVPDDTGFSEQTTTLILGSRRPILFVEGDTDSLDIAIYRTCYPDWTIVPRGSCEEVIHSVVTMRRNQHLTRVHCSGIVDADDYQADDLEYLRNLGVAALPVSEIENIVLLPQVSRAIAESDGYTGAELADRLDSLKEAVFQSLNTAAAVDRVVTRYCRRRIDRLLKKVDLSAAGDVSQITADYIRQTAALDIQDIAQRATNRISEALRDRDLPTLLANYDNKALMSLAATHLRRTRLADFESWLVRVLRNNSVPNLIDAIRHNLPVVEAQ